MTDLRIHHPDPKETERLIYSAYESVNILSVHCANIANNGPFKERDHYKHKMFAANSALHILWKLSRQLTKGNSDDFI